MSPTPPKTNLKEEEKTKSMEKPDEDMPRLEKAYMVEIEDKIARDLKEGVVSVEYDLPWEPEDKNVVSGARRPLLTDYKFYIGDKYSDPVKKFDLNALKKRKEEIEKKSVKPDSSFQQKEYTAEDVRDLDRFIATQEAWKPQNVYRSNTDTNYNTKTKEFSKSQSEGVKKAIADYQEFADDLNKMRKTPIRNIYFRKKFYPDGRTTLDVSWRILRTREIKNKDGSIQIINDPEYPFYREYEVRGDDAKFVGGSTISKVKQEIEEEERKEKEAEEKKKTKTEERETKKAEKEKEKAEKQKERAKKETEKETAEQKKLEADLKSGKKTDRVYHYKLRQILDAHEEDKISYEEMKKQAKALKEEFSKK
jgi:hypothetical protein